MNDLKSADLEKRASLLDVREKFISEKERIINDVDRIAKVEVLDKQIIAKETVLSEIQDKIDTENKFYSRFKSSHEEEQKIIEASVEQVRRKEDNLLKVYTQLQHDVGSKRRELNAIKEETIASKKYAKEQEEVVNKTVSEWNSTLTEFQQEADLIQTSKNKLSGDIIRLEQDKISMETEIKEIQVKFNTLTDTYEARALSYRNELKEINDRIATRQDDFDMLEAKNKVRLKDVESREKSVQLKEIALKNKEQEYIQREQRLKMNYGLAGLDYI